MIRSLYTAVSGMVSLEAQQTAITSNLANINTKGYKTEEVNLKSFEEVMLQNKDNKNGEKRDIGGISLGVAIDGTYVRGKQGIFNITDNTTDFAIDGEGYFVVNRNGEDFYTRDGKFRASTNGYLINGSGDSVMGENIQTGQLEPIYVGTDNFVMNSNNELSVNGENATYKLATATFEEPVIKYGDGLYKGEDPDLDAKVYIAQGTLEDSNVNLVNEMANMLSVMRAFESNQKVIQTIDESLGKAASEIGSVR
ncbi:flagellar hook-basal body complex protein [uncultured Clostridium sp.]|uniref:flagellar hook-basal body complex protein n=1 Tax=uncultured Clostridium sp. TaxID=59620 RepID=UPI00260E86A4|nr:flagellar hook-basal body complex protein [uncultured Clostridium sp.]